jgi:hypothetical protein
MPSPSSTAHSGEEAHSEEEAQRAEERAQLADSTCPTGKVEVQATEVAWTLAHLAPALPEATATDLKRLLSRSLTSPTSGEKRQARLGLLIDLVRQSPGQVPAVAAYNAARAERANYGESWPTHSSLLRAHGGHWLAAVRAAMGVAFDGARAKVPHREHRNTHAPAYSPNEVLEAVAACWRDLALDPGGDGPTLGEYLEWVGLRRSGARLAGKPAPRLPGRDPIRRHFKTWDKLLPAGSARTQRY